eukprot:3710705-Rhodomonas_salina.7
MQRARSVTTARSGWQMRSGLRGAEPHARAPPPAPRPRARRPDRSPRSHSHIPRVAPRFRRGRAASDGHAARSGRIRRRRGRGRREQLWDCAGRGIAGASLRAL